MVFANDVVGTLAAGWVDVANPVTVLVSGTEGHAYVRDGALYFQSPAAVATVSLPQQWRSQQAVRVRINPVQVDDARRQMVVYQALRVAVRFVTTTG